MASAIAVDALRNVYVTGYSPALFHGRDYVTVKYDTDGNQQWVERYDGPGHNRDEQPVIAVDGAGNVYVAGRSVGVGTGPDYVLLKYSGDRRVHGYPGRITIFPHYATGRLIGRQRQVSIRVQFAEQVDRFTASRDKCVASGKD